MPRLVFCLILTAPLWGQLPRGGAPPAGVKPADAVKVGAANTAAVGMTLDMSAATTADALKTPVIAGGTSGADGSIVYDSTGKLTHVRTNGADSIAAVTTATSTTTSNVLHATAVAGVYANSNPAASDFGTQAARSVLANATSGAANSGFGSTVDVTAYQLGEIPSTVFVASSDFTTSGSGTALENITGLSWTMPGSTALNVPFSCHIIYHQNSAAVVVAFGIRDVTTSPTNINAEGIMFTSATVLTAGNLVALASTTATAIVSATPSAITTNWVAQLTGLIEQPSGTASVINIMVSTATQGDTVTVKRGSYCRLW